MLPNKHFASEPQFLCSVCSQAITNPLCPTCLTTEIQAWLTLYPDLRRGLLPKLFKYLHDIEEKVTDSTTSCLKCKNKRASICPYCFTDYVLNQLKRLNANRIILKEFFEFFNFDLDHTGYSKEAEHLGVI